MNKITTYSFDGAAGNEYYATCEKFNGVLILKNNSTWRITNNFTKAQLADYISNSKQKTERLIKEYPLPLNWIEEQPIEPEDITDDFI